MDGNTLPDIADPRFSIKQPAVKDPSAVFGLMGLVNDVLLYYRNRAVETEDSRINVFAFYKVGEDGYGIQSLDIQNATGADVSVKGVLFSSSQSVYEAQPGPSIQPINGYYGFSPVARANSTTTVSIVPSGNSKNPMNIFANDQNVQMIISLWHTQTGMQYKLIKGGIH